MARSYKRLSPKSMNETWVRLRAGQAVKPTDRHPPEVLTATGPALLTRWCEHERRV